MKRTIYTKTFVSLSSIKYKNAKYVYNATNILSSCIIPNSFNSIPGMSDKGIPTNCHLSSYAYPLRNSDNSISCLNAGATSIYKCKGKCVGIKCASPGFKWIQPENIKLPHKQSIFKDTILSLKIFSLSKDPKYNRMEQFCFDENLLKKWHLIKINKTKES